MKLSTDFRSALHDLVHSPGEEFNLHDLVPDVVDLLRDEGQDDEVMADIAYRLLREQLRDDGGSSRGEEQMELFAYKSDRVLALGAGQYCPMATIDADRAERRRSTVTRNYKAVAAKWSAEDDYWESRIPNLRLTGGVLGDIEDPAV